MNHNISNLTIDLTAIANNYRYLQSVAKGAECTAVVKSNAYGLGLERVAPALAGVGCKSFFVATLDEGIQLRNVLPSQDIYVFHGVIPGQEQVFIEYRLIPVLNELYQITLWNQAAANHEKPLPAVIHIDTGMARLGLTQRSAFYLDNHREMVSNLDIRFVMSHLACADEPDHFKNSRQYINFTEIQKYAPEMKLSLANSSGMFLSDKFHFDLVRPGSALYGINPTPLSPNPMKTVVTLTSRILQIRDIDLMQTVGYGATYKALPGTRIAVITVGYADGYLRSLSNKGYGVINGKQAPIVGRISMDLITLDITEFGTEEVQIGTVVELIGNQCPVDDIASKAGSNAYELLSRLGSRFKREYI